MDEIKAGENRPSEVFLALWYYRAKREPLTVENFKLCAETWRELANKEDRHKVYAETWRELVNREARHAADETLDLSPLHPEDSGPSRAAAPTDPPEPESGPDRTPKETDAEPEARKAEEAAKVRSDAGAKGLATRKQNVLHALEEFRLTGVKLQEIADADQRLSLNDVLRMLEHKPVSLPVLAALERAISALRARDAGPSEEDMS